MEIRFTWGNLNYGTQRIEVYRDTAPFDDDALPALLVTLPADALEFSDTDVVVGNTYYYRIGAYVDGVLALTDLLSTEVVDAVYSIDRMTMQTVYRATSSNLQVSRMIMQVVTKEN